MTDISNLSLPERMALIAKERQRKLEDAVRKREEEELNASTCSFRPQINKQSKAIDRALPLVDYFQNWISDRDLKLTSKRNESEAASPASPATNPRSAKLAEKWRTRDRSPSPPPEEPSFQPKINPKSASLQNDVPLPERLSSVAEERRSRLEELRRQKLLEEEEELKKSLSPDISLLNRVRGSNIEDDLYVRDKEAQERRLLKLTQQLHEEQAQYKPKINQRSRQLASNRNPASKSSSRNTSPGEKVMNPDDDPDLTFTPKINPTSSKIASGATPKGTPRTLYLYKKKSEIERSRESLASSLADRETVGCTFSPRITKKAKKASSSTPSFQTEGSIVSRTEAWKKKREQRVKNEKERLLEEELKECTFTPKRPQSKVQPPKKASLDQYYGVSSFVQRQQKARQLRDEQDPNKLVSNGSKWNGSLTKPQPFRFNNRDRNNESNNKPTTPVSNAFVVLDDVDPMQDVNINEWKARKKEKHEEESVQVSLTEKPWRTGTNIDIVDSPKSDRVKRKCGCCTTEFCQEMPDLDDIDFTDTQGRHAGELEFYKRLQQSRIKPEEPKTTWSPEVTVPKEFKFNQRPASGQISSLARPYSDGGRSVLNLDG
ncbi:hypothetical protein P9112_014721 [Eukaryota sp. TZLM1-RC]